MLRRQGPLTALVMAVSGYTPLHAAGIQTPRGLLAIAGPAAAGKSTVAALAYAGGWPVAGDDVLAMDRDLTILPLPGALRTDAPWVGPTDSVTADGRKLVPLSPLFGKQRLMGLVTVVRGSHPLLATVTGAERLAIFADALLGGFLSDQEEQILECAANVPVYRLTVPGDLAALHSSWPIVRNLLAEACG
ncbi:MAG: hypothetical protein ABI836_12825 [Gemmatimonadota bacterium]